MSKGPHATGGAEGARDPVVRAVRVLPGECRTPPMLAHGSLGEATFVCSVARLRRGKIEAREPLAPDAKPAVSFPERLATTPMDRLRADLYDLSEAA